MDFMAPTPLGLVLDQLVTLFEGKIDGYTDTSKLYLDAFSTPIDTAIQTQMDEVRSVDEFALLRDADDGGPFMDRWWELEDLWNNWEAQETLPERGWFREVVGLYKSQTWIGGVGNGDSFWASVL